MPGMHVKISGIDTQALFITLVTGDEFIYAVVCDLLGEPALQSPLNGRPAGAPCWLEIGEDLQRFALQSKSDLDLSSANQAFNQPASWTWVRYVSIVLSSL